jgi:Icc-related predicted phosphoesterase
MKIVALSDTHGEHRSIDKEDVPKGDVLIHAGDFTKHGRINELEDFIEWFSQFPHEHKIFVAGNHDACMQNHENEELPINPEMKDKINEILSDAWFEDNIIYLHNSGKTINGITFYGSPYSNTLPDWHFNTDDEENEGVWEGIFDDTDVLITHGPPKGKLDYLGGEWNEHIGDEDLAEKVQELDLEAHIFGHVHSHNGSDGISYNVSILNEDYEIDSKPLVIEIESGK